MWWGGVGHVMTRGVKLKLKKMVFSYYKKMRILYLSREGRKPPTIAKILKEEGMSASRKGIANFLKRYEETGTIARLPGSGRPSKVT